MFPGVVFGPRKAGASCGSISVTPVKPTCFKARVGTFVQQLLQLRFARKLKACMHCIIIIMNPLPISGIQHGQIDHQVSSSTRTTCVTARFLERFANSRTTISSQELGKVFSTMASSINGLGRTLVCSLFQKSLPKTKLPAGPSASDCRVAEWGSSIGLGHTPTNIKEGELRFFKISLYMSTEFILDT